MKPSVRRAGFTLMEMLVVILIIGVLAAGAITYGNRAREMAMQTKARSLAGQIVFSWSLYLRDNRRFPLDAAGSPVVVKEMDPATCDLLNKDGKCYLEVSKEEDEGLDGRAKAGVLDPWGWRAYKQGLGDWEKRRMQVCIDNGTGRDKTAYDTLVSVPDIEASGDSTKEVSGHMAAWSKGKDLERQRDDLISKQ